MKILMDPDPKPRSNIKTQIFESVTSVSEPEIDMFPSSVSALSRILENSSSETPTRPSRLIFRLNLKQGKLNQFTRIISY